MVWQSVCSDVHLMCESSSDVVEFLFILRILQVLSVMQWENKVSAS